MGNNINNINLNGEYVKFYYTTNKVLPDLLKNTGALVVYNNIEEGTDKPQNYIYLGGELLSSGIGFHDEDIKNNLININDEYYIRMAYNEGQITDIYNKIKKIDSTALFEGGNINECLISTYLTETGVESNNIELTSLFNIVEQKYEPAYISEEITTIKYVELTSENINLKYSPENNQQYTTQTVVIDNNTDIINLPIGTLITEINKRIKIDLCDETRISYMMVTSYYNNPYDIYNSSYESIIDRKVYNKTNINSNYTLTNIVNIDYKENFINMPPDITNTHSKTFVICPNENILMNEFLCYTSGTINKDKLKKIDKITINGNSINQENLDIYSIKNLLPGKVLTGKKIKINGVLPLLYCPCNYDNYGTIYTENLKTVNKFNRIVLSDETKFNVPSNTVRLYIGVPRSTIIKNIYLIDKFSNNVKLNITGLFINFKNENGVIPQYMDAYPMIYNNRKTNLYFKYKYLFIDLFETIHPNINSENFDIIVECENYDYDLNIVEELPSGQDFINHFNFLPHNSEWICEQNEVYMSHNWITIKGNNNLSNYIDISSKYYSGNDVNIYNTPSKYWNTHINQLNNIKDITFDGEYNILPEYYKNNYYTVLETKYNKYICETFSQYNIFNVKSDPYIKFTISDFKNFYNGNPEFNDTNTLKSIQFTNNLGNFITPFITKDRITNNTTQQTIKEKVIDNISNYFNGVKYNKIDQLEENNISISFKQENPMIENLYFIKNYNKTYNISFNFENFENINSSSIYYPYIILPYGVNIRNIQYKFVIVNDDENNTFDKEIIRYEYHRVPFTYKETKYNIITPNYNCKYISDSKTYNYFEINFDKIYDKNGDLLTYKLASIYISFDI